MFSKEVNSRRTDSLNADERVIKQRWGCQFKKINWRGTFIRGLKKHTASIEFKVTFATNLAILIIITVLMVNSRKLADRIGCGEYEMATNGSVRDNP